MKRYQDCNKLEKLWRKRWYLVVPFVSVWIYLKRTKVYHDMIIDGELVNTDEYSILSFKECWSIAIGSVQMKMNHFYTMEEMEQIFDTKNKQKSNHG